MSGRRTAATAVALALALAGCSTPPPAPPVDTVWGETSVFEELAIGVASGPEEHMFGDVRTLAVAPDGKIYVAETQPISRPDGRQVLLRAYDADGEYLHDVGRVGQGPGEYEVPFPSVLPDGRLAVWDPRSTRLSLFSAGDHLGSVPVDSSYATFRTDVEGNFWVQDVAEQRVRDGVPRGVFERYSMEGELLDTFPLPSEWPDRAGPARTDFVLMYEGYIRPFTVLTRYVVSPLGYLVVGHNDSYDIELRKPEGTVHLTRDLERVALRPEEQAEWNEFRDGLVRRTAEAGTQVPGRQVEFLPIPDHKPFFRELYAGEEGRIWVFRYVAAEKRDVVEPVPGRPDRPLLTWREPFTYDVFEPDGRFLGTVVLPDDFEPRVFRGTRIWGTRTDEAGVEQVVRLRVVPEAQ